VLVTASRLCHPTVERPAPHANCRKPQGKNAGKMPFSAIDYITDLGNYVMYLETKNGDGAPQASSDRGGGCG
jgi:hypothetical protein